MNKNNYKFISIDTIANRIKKHPLLKDINPEDIISHTVDVLRLVGSSNTIAYKEMSTYLPVIEYKAAIPDNNLNIKSVDFVFCKKHIPMVIATDTHNTQLHNRRGKRGNENMYTYTSNGNLIHTNQQEGEIFVVYDTIMCDENGYPMIPDNISLIKAIENYIKVQVFTVYVDLGKLGPQSLQRVEQEYNWYIGKAQSDFAGLQNDDDMESFLRDFKKLFIQNKDHQDRRLYEVQRELKFKGR